MGKPKQEIKSNKLTEERMARAKAVAQTKEPNEPPAQESRKKTSSKDEKSTTTDDLRSTDNEEDKIIPFLCEPCRMKKKRQDAIGFCDTCLDFLCSDCTEAHKKGRMVRTHFHNILEGDEMPNELDTDVSKEVCKCASGFVKFFCKDHKCLLCKICKLYTHKRCHIASIIDIAEDFVESKQFKTEMKELQSIRTKSDKFRKRCQSEINRISTRFSSILEEIKEIRRKITEAIDKFEDEIKRELNRLFAKEEQLITDKKVKCELLKSSVDKKINTVEKLKGECNDVEVFVTFYKSQGETKKLQESLNAIQKGTEELDVTFTKNSLIDAFMQIERLGELKVSKVAKDKPVKDVPVKPLWDKRRLLWSPDLLPEAAATERPKPKSETFVSKNKGKEGLKSAPVTDIRNATKRTTKSETQKTESSDQKKAVAIPPIKQYVSKRNAHYLHAKRKAVMEKYRTNRGIFY